MIERGKRETFRISLRGSLTPPARPITLEKPGGLVLAGDRLVLVELAA